MLSIDFKDLSTIQKDFLKKLGHYFDDFNDKKDIDKFTYAPVYCKDENKIRLVSNYGLLTESVEQFKEERPPELYFGLSSLIIGIYHEYKVNYTALFDSASNRYRPIENIARVNSNGLVDLIDASMETLFIINKKCRNRIILPGSNKRKSLACHPGGDTIDWNNESKVAGGNIDLSYYCDEDIGAYCSQITFIFNSCVDVYDLELWNQADGTGCYSKIITGKNVFLIQMVEGNGRVIGIFDGPNGFVSMFSPSRRIHHAIITELDKDRRLRL